MRKVVLQMGMGLNGIGSEGWAPSVEGSTDFQDLYDDMWNYLKSVDTYLLGRKCYQLWERVWPPLAKDPSSSGLEKKFSRFTDQIQKVVFSKTLKSVSWANSTLVTGDLSEEIARMRARKGKDMAIVGGPGIAQTFTRLGLIDEYRLWLHPTILGYGTSLLGVPPESRSLDLVESRRYRSGVIGLHYKLR